MRWPDRSVAAHPKALTGCSSSGDLAILFLQRLWGGFLSAFVHVREGRVFTVPTPLVCIKMANYHTDTTG